MENTNIGEALMETIEPTVETAPEPQPAQPEPTQPEPIPSEPAVAQQPSFDPNLFVGALENIHTRMDELQRPTQPDVAPSEEEQIMAELAEKMGLSSVKQENEQLKAMLEEMKGQSAQMQEYMQQQQINAAQDGIVSKYDGITKEMVYGKLQELAQQYGEDFANSLNNSQGWEYVISTQLQRPPAQPDPIVSTSGTGDDFLDTANQRIQSGKAQDGDIGELLFSHLG